MTLYHRELMKGKEAAGEEIRVIEKDEDSTTALLTNEFPEDETDDEEYRPNPEQVSVCNSMVLINLTQLQAFLFYIPRIKVMRRHKA